MENGDKATSDEWRLREPDIRLSAAEREWFEWARSGACDVLGDPDWLADNEDALTVGGQLADMRYRLEEQAPDVAETGARKRVLASLLRKLGSAGWFNEGYHE